MDVVALEENHIILGLNPSLYAIPPARFPYYPLFTVYILKHKEIESISANDGWFHGIEFLEN